MRYFVAILGLLTILFPHKSQAMIIEDACSGFSASLRDCKPFSCQYERPASTDNPVMIVARYEVTGKDENGACGYKVSLDGTQVMSCKLSPESLETMARISELQIEGKYEKEKNKLLEAMKTMDRETGKIPDSAMDEDLREFMDINNAFATILGNECQ